MTGGLLWLEEARHCEPLDVLRELIARHAVFDSKPLGSPTYARAGNHGLDHDDATCQLDRFTLSTCAAAADRNSLRRVEIASCSRVVSGVDGIEVGKQLVARPVGDGSADERDGNFVLSAPAAVDRRAVPLMRRSSNP